MPPKIRNNIKRETIVKQWETDLKNERFNTTYEESLTNCWACGSNFGGELERCHIIPTILGGEMKAENMILMCQFCNKQNPETIYEDDFWRWVESRKGTGFIMINDNPMKYDKEHELMFGHNFSESMKFCLEKENKHKGILHAEKVQKSFNDQFYTFLKNNTDKYYLRYPATMAIALNHFFHIWVEQNFTENSEFISREQGPEYDSNGKIVLPPIESLKFPKSLLKTIEPFLIKNRDMEI